jgi:hypothetical protein
MATLTRVLGLAFVGSVLAVGCVISSDDDKGVFDDGDASIAGDGDPNAGDGDPNVGDGDPETDAATGDGDPNVGDGDVTPDGGDEPVCFAPDQSDSCGACVANNCYAEWCACDADSTCGLPAGDDPGDEFYCVNNCVLELSNMGETAADAFATCAEGCAVSQDGALADTTQALISCLRAGVPDPLFADAGADAGAGEVAVCGYDCFGYEELE